MSSNTLITALCLSVALLVGCNDKNVPAPERPTIHDVDVSTDGGESSGDNAAASFEEQLDTFDKVTSWSPPSPFRLASYAKDNETPESSVENDDDDDDGRSLPEISILAIRLVRCDLAEDAPARKDTRLSHPPSLYVIVKKGESRAITSDAKKGWSVTFSDNPQHEFHAERSSDAACYFEIHDSQRISDKRIASVGPVSEKEIVAGFLDDKGKGEKKKQIKLVAEESKVTLTLERVGVVRWYRLANVNIPGDSPSRKLLAGREAKLFVKLLRNGEALKNRSGKDSSTVLTRGAWEGNYPRAATNCWPILEDADAHYDLEVWDCHWKDELLFRISGLSGEDFKEVIREKGASQYDGEEGLGSVTFEMLDSPITE